MVSIESVHDSYDRLAILLSPDSTLTILTSCHDSALPTDSEADAELATPKSGLEKIPVRRDSMMPLCPGSHVEHGPDEVQLAFDGLCCLGTKIATGSEADAELATHQSLPIQLPARPASNATDSEADAELATPESVCSNIVIVAPDCTHNDTPDITSVTSVETSSGSVDMDLTDMSGCMRLAKKTVALKRPRVRLRRSRRQAKTGEPEYVYMSTDDGGRMVRNRG